MAQRLGDAAIGSIVKIKVNGEYKEFIVVHQGNPDPGVYDSSCDGTWLLMKDIYEIRQWHSSNVNDYAGSTIHSYLNSTFLNLFDADIKAQIKQVKIPYRAGSGTSKTVTSGANGLSAKIFLLSSTETSFNHSYMPTNEGAELSYFSGCTDDGADSKRIAYLNGTVTRWWLRSPYTVDSGYALFVSSSGGWNGSNCSNSYGVRPALVLPSTLLVSDDGSVQTNTAPTISSASGASGVNLGSKTSGFNFQYTVADADGDSLTVTEKLDGVTKRSFTAASGTTQTFQAVTAANFQKVLNGSHTMNIVVSDGNESVTFTATFTKAVYAASITLSAPLSVAGDIEVAILSVSGNIPEDASYKVEVNNNALDSVPAWQDCTAEVKAGENIVFENKTSANGAAFNFRISVSRGASGAGGYIDAVRGAFQ